jgi:carboxymethylenebutenolidase
MQNIFLSIFTFFLTLISGFQQKSAPQTQSNDLKTVPLAMCHDTYATDMNAFAFDPIFQSLHPTPQDIDFVEMGKNINFPTPDGGDAKAYFVKAKKKSKKWLFVYQEWWGLNDHIKRQADKFYEDLGGDVNVIALDMYDGKSTTDRQEAAKLMTGAKEERLQSIVKGASKFAGRKAKIANVGWCFGGGWSLKSALELGKKSIGSVIYYGMPVRDVAQLKTLKCDVLGLFATEEYISKEIIEEFATAMKTAGKQLEYKIFPGVHGFSNPSNPKYDEKLSGEAYSMAIKYLKGKY